LFFVFFIRFVVNKINCRQNDPRLELKAGILSFSSNNKEEQRFLISRRPASPAVQL